MTQSILITNVITCWCLGASLIFLFSFFLNSVHICFVLSWNNNSLMHKNTQLSLQKLIWPIEIQYVVKWPIVSKFTLFKFSLKVKQNIFNLFILFYRTQPGFFFYYWFFIAWLYESFVFRIPLCDGSASLEKTFA